MFIVADCFAMLTAELNGQPHLKSDYRKALILGLAGRSDTGLADWFGEEDTDLDQPHP
jgi:hypothetical protein